MAAALLSSPGGDAWEGHSLLLGWAVFSASVPATQALAVALLALPSARLGAHKRRAALQTLLFPLCGGSRAFVLQLLAWVRRWGH